MYGSLSDDVIEGGTGNDILIGGIGADTYVFIHGDGHDIIEDLEGRNHIVFKDVKSTDNIQIQESTESLIITYNDVNNIQSKIDIKLVDHIKAWKAEDFTFSDGITLSQVELPIVEHLIKVGDGENHIEGGYETDYLVGNDDNNYIIAQDGNDYIIGGAGNDNLHDIEGINTIDFLNISSKDAVRNGNDLVVEYSSKPFDYGNSVTIRDFFDDNQQPRETLFKFSDGLTLNAEQMVSFANADNGYEESDSLSGGEESSYLMGNKGDDDLQGSNKNDVMVGGRDNDHLDGMGGDDLYLFSQGDGRDIYHDNQGENIIQFVDVKSTDRLYTERVGDNLNV